MHHTHPTDTGQYTLTHALHTQAEHTIAHTYAHTHLHVPRTRANTITHAHICSLTHLVQHTLSQSHTHMHRHGLTCPHAHTCPFLMPRCQCNPACANMPQPPTCSHVHLHMCMCILDVYAHTCTLRLCAFAHMHAQCPHPNTRCTPTAPHARAPVTLPPPGADTTQCKCRHMRVLP